MSGLISSGSAVDVVLAVLGLEIAAVAGWRRGNQQAVRLANLIIAGLPGVFLLLALRAALTGAHWAWVAFWLAISFPAHLADLWRRPP